MIPLFFCHINVTFLLGCEGWWPGLDGFTQPWEVGFGLANSQRNTLDPAELRGQKGHLPQEVTAAVIRQNEVWYLRQNGRMLLLSKIESVFLSQSWSIWSTWSAAESRDRWTCSLCRRAWRFQHEWKSLRRLSFYRCTGDAKHWKETLGMSDSKLMNPQKCNRICSTRLLRLGKPQPLWFDWDWCLRVRGFKAFQAELWCARWMLQSLFAFELLRRLAH